MNHPPPNPPSRRVRSAVLASLCLAAGLALAAPLPAPDADRRITPNFKDIDLGQIVDAVSKLTGKNFIIDPRVKAQVTMMSSTPMSPDAFYEAFLAILQVHGFVAVQSGSVYKIVPDANARTLPAVDLPDHVSSVSDEIVTQVVALRSVSAAQLVPILRPLMPQYGHLAAYPAANVLILSDHANNVARLLKVIDRIDRSSDDEFEVQRLEHASAVEIVRVVNQLAQAGGEQGSTAKLIADERTNSVLLSGEKNQRLRFRALIAHLDTPIEKGGGTTVRYLHYADAEKLAQKLKEQVQATTASTTTGGAGGAQAVGSAEKNVSIWAEPTTNALVMTAPPKLMRQLNDVIDRLDIRRLEVQVEAIIVEITGNKNIDLGVNWAIDASGSNIGAGAFNEPIGSSGPSIASVAAAAAGGTAGLSAASVPSGFTYAVGRIAKTGTNFAAILNAIAGTANTNIISTPTVVTLDNQEAQIKVATEVPFVTGQYSSTTTAQTAATGATGIVNPFQTIQRQEVGTILKITPQITDDGTVLLKIEQEVSSLIKSAIATVDVQTSKRVINTRVLANDGEIIVLGGLISDNVTESEQRVPILGSIPLIGNLFKTRSSTKDKTNLMVFLRPKILVNAEQMAIETQAKYNYIRSLQTQQGGKVSMIPGERQPTLPDLKTLTPAAAPAETPKMRAARGKPEPVPAPPTAPLTEAPPEAATPPKDPGR
ncbi:MAG: type II secretion system secretin GspD [Proteobacteria bacterium]|nr:type II secretion system secretin GspD [Pseudomonadota bacterium]